VKPSVRVGAPAHCNAAQRLATDEDAAWIEAEARVLQAEFAREGRVPA
jgi:hypothetical protein